LKILLTGSRGQVGQALINANHHFSHALIACDRQILDISDVLQVKKAINHHQPDAVINAAGYTAVDKAESEKELAYSVNETGAKNLAQICENLRIPLFHLSTDYIFDGKKMGAYQEDDVPAPLNVYGESKWLGEQAIRENCEKHCILRISWMFSEHGNNFVKTMLRLMQEREELRMVNDQTGCPTYAGDVAHTLLSMCDQQHWGTYHYCGLPATTWYGFANIIHDKAKKFLTLRVKNIYPITSADYAMPAKRPQNSVLNCQKFIKTFGIQQTLWRNGLINVIKRVMR
jgi:dTDP-4-dehydrorhamnose reductase